MIICAIIGYRKGLLGVLYNLLSWIFIAAFVIVLSPYINDYIVNSTSWSQSISDIIRDYISQHEGVSFLATGSDLVSTVTGYILRGISCLIALIIAKIICRLVYSIIKHVQDVPIIHGICSWIGMVLGLCKGVIITWIFMFIVSITQLTQFGQYFIPMIDKSQLLTFLYNNNLAVTLIDHFL